MPSATPTRVGGVFALAARMPSATPRASAGGAFLATFRGMPTMVLVMALGLGKDEWRATNAAYLVAHFAVRAATQ